MCVSEGKGVEILRHSVHMDAHCMIHDPKTKQVNGRDEDCDMSRIRSWIVWDLW